MAKEHRQEEDRQEARFRDAREQMVARDIEGRGILDPAVIRAMGVVARERFLPPDQAELAYRDSALPIAEGQTISQPYIVAAMTEALLPDENDRILEIGTGSGYQTAVLAEVAREVFTVERIASLSERASETLEDLGYENVRFRVGDGSTGWPEEAPFDAILVTAASPEVPAPLLRQMSEDDGRLVIPVGPQKLQTLERIRRSGNEFSTESLMGCRFVPLLGERGW